MVPAGALLAAQMSARLPVHYERINARHSPLIGLRLRDRGVAVPAGGSLAPWSSAHWHCRRPPSPLGAGLFHERPSGERERERVAHEGMPNREMRGGGFAKRLLACNGGGRRGRGVARHDLQPQGKLSRSRGHTARSPIHGHRPLPLKDTGHFSGNRTGTHFSFRPIQHSHSYLTPSLLLNSSFLYPLLSFVRVADRAGVTCTRTRTQAL